jgi:hypothetical protein
MRQSNRLNSILVPARSPGFVAAACLFSLASACTIVEDGDDDTGMPDVGSDVVDTGGDTATDTNVDPDGSSDETANPDTSNDVPDEGTDVAPDTSTDTTPDDTTDTTPDVEADAEADVVADTTPDGPGWAVFAHPCVGNRTDALHCDDANTCYVGCGTTTEGRGLYMTDDGGATWGEPVTDPEDILSGARVNDIFRGDDGLLYVAGEITGPTRVVSLANDGTLAEVWNSRPTVGFGFTAGSFRRNSDGWAIAESLTGTDVVYREGDDTDATDSWLGARFWDDGGADDVSFGVQILAMEVHNDLFYGVGSTISQPPIVLLPNWTAGTFDFSIVQLAASGLSAFSGELWDIDVNDEVIVAGGVNQDADVAVIFSHPNNSEATDASAWRRFNVNRVPTLADAASWVTGVCVGEDVIYAVGREAREGWGFILRSTDNGQTFEDISPYSDGATSSDFDDVSRCEVAEDGTLIVAGAGGLFAVYQPE